MDQMKAALLALKSLKKFAQKNMISDVLGEEESGEMPAEVEIKIVADEEGEPLAMEMSEEEVKYKPYKAKPLSEEFNGLPLSVKPSSKKQKKAKKEA